MREDLRIFLDRWVRDRDFRIACAAEPWRATEQFKSRPMTRAALVRLIKKNDPRKEYTFFGRLRQLLHL